MLIRLAAGRFVVNMKRLTVCLVCLLMVWMTTGTHTGCQGKETAVQTAKGVLQPGTGLHVGVQEPAQEPVWPMKVISWDFTKAYPGIPYEYRLGVQGGSYPYVFRLTSAPEGMTIHQTTGEITWLADQTLGQHEIRVEVSDQKGNRITHSFALKVAKDAFRFVSRDGSDQNPGTEALPFASVEHAVKTTSNSRYIYVKEGSYPVQFDIGGDDCGKLLAYPGHQVKLIGEGTHHAKIGLLGHGEYVVQGFDCDANGSRWFFSVDSPHLSNLIIRKNRMFNILDDSLENPAFLFFWDGPQKPILGEAHYQNILVQDNIFHKLRNPHVHGASVTLYNVQDLIYEDNIVYDIDGNGFLDKDDGFRNTIRNNIIHGCINGIALTNQHTQGSINIHHNLVYNCQAAAAVGWQPGFLRDVYIHHNTLLGSVLFGSVLHNKPDSYNINLFNNIIGNGSDFPYQFSPVEEGNHYVFPSYVQNPKDDTLRSDQNLFWVNNPDRLAGYEWGLPDMSMSDWQAAGFDLNSLLDHPGLDTNHALSPDSPYYGSYGRDNPLVPLPGAERQAPAY